MKAIKIMELCLCVCIGGTFFACDPDSGKTVIINEPDKVVSNNADFVVVNTTTGESLKNRGITVAIGGDVEKLEIHEGDVLELTYTPKKEYSEKYGNLSYGVRYSLFGENVVVSDAPYVVSYKVKDVSPGTYEIRCATSANSDKASITENGIVNVLFVKDK